MKLISFISVVALLCSISTAGTAQEQKQKAQEKPNSYKAVVDIGVLLENTTSTISTYGNEKITTTDKEGEASNYTTFFPLLDFRYFLNESKTQLYFGTPTDGENYEIGAGVVQSLSKIGNLTAIVATSARAEEWKNPYQVNVAREKTDLSETSLKLKLAHVGTTPFNVSYVNKTVRLEDDEIGEFSSDLKRDGSVNYLDFSYDVSINRTNRITPGITLEKADLEGKANSYDKTKINLQYLRFSQTAILIAKGSFSNASFGGSHPLYDETRNETGVRLGIAARLPNLFDVNSLHSNLGLAGEWVDSNIDFFDSQTIEMVLTLGYTF